MALPLTRALSYLQPARLGLPRFAALVLLPFYGALVLLDAAAATAMAAGLALIGAVWTLHHTNATARRTLTAEYRARWEHPDLFGPRLVTAKFLDLKGSHEASRWRRLMTDIDPKERVEILATLNFWEEVASAYNQGYLDKGWFRTDLAWRLQENWIRAEWFIRKCRLEQKDAAVYSEWQIAIEAVQPDLDQQDEVGQKLAEKALGDKQDLLHVRQPTY